MSRKRDIKKSQFTTVTDSDTGDTFDFVRNGQNLKIAQSDLISALGVTGSLETRGEIAGVPVLRVIAGVNYIRNIIGGPGITATVSSQDGVEISHNFDVDTTGVPVVINAGATSPTIRSLEAGPGINVAGSGGVIQISSSEVAASTKTVIVTEIGDFPDPDLVVTDLIYLEDDTEYRVQNDVSSAYRFAMGSNTVLSGADQTLITLEYTGIGIMITAADVTCRIKDISLACASGTLYDISSTTGLHSFRFSSCNVECDNVGNLDNLAGAYLDHVNFSVGSNGATFSGAFSVAVLEFVTMNIPSGNGTIIELGTATFDLFQLLHAFGSVNGTGYALSGAAGSANINAGGLGTVQNSKQFGASANLNNISPFDDRWEFSSNPEVPNSYDVALVTHGGATLTIAAAATPVIVGATWTEQKAYRFTTTAGGRWTYTGKVTNVEINASVTVDVASSVHDVSLFIYKNGVQITASRVTTEVSAADPINMSLIWETDLDTGDYLELWTQNDDAAINILIVSATVRIRS